MRCSHARITALVASVAFRARMITFIIPAYNEESTIGQTIGTFHSAGNAALGPYELVHRSLADKQRKHTITPARIG